MVLRPPGSKRASPRFPSTTLFRSALDAADVAQYPLHFLLKQNNGDALPLLGAREFFEPWQLVSVHLPIQKQQRCQCLVLCARADVPIRCEMRQKRLDL